MVQRAAAGRCLCHTLTEFWMVKVCGGLLDVSHFLVCHMCFLSSQRYLNWTHIIKPSQAAGEMRAHSPLSLHSAPLCVLFNEGWPGHLNHSSLYEEKSKNYHQLAGCHFHSWNKDVLLLFQGAGGRGNQASGLAFMAWTWLATWRWHANSRWVEQVRGWQPCPGAGTRRLRNLVESSSHSPWP